jgi:predicted  nucleic acid-binding Zn-ribbon protein
MTPEEEEARQLHDRATRGEALSAGDRRQLEDWYSQQDAAEAVLLTTPRTEIELSQLERRIAATLQRIGEVTRQIQHVTDETYALRRENEALKHRLARVLYESRG